MCGRYTLTRPGRELRDVFDLDATPDITPRYNIAPTQESVVVRRAAAAGRRAELASWGFGAFGAGDAANGDPPPRRRLLINARAETAAVKPSFRDSFSRRRCLVPADGFYEWRRERGRPRPFHFSAADGGLFAFAGLWQPTLGPAARPGLAFTILTVPANELVAAIHPRMPLILPSAAWGDWLRAGSGREALEPLLVPFPAAGMASREVSAAVNAVANDSPDCLAAPDPSTAIQLDLLT